MGNPVVRSRTVGKLNDCRRAGLAAR